MWLKSYLFIWLFMIASLSSVWLQIAGSFVIAKPILCVSLQKLLDILWLQKKRLNSVCLQLFCVRDCNQKFSVVEKPDCVCVVKKLLGYLVIYDYKHE
jgi:hypothetical protein